MAYKIALTAGHYKYEAGKRCLKTLDPNETREWVLNARIADKVAQLLAVYYTGYELIRTDDTTGEKEVTLANRVAKANNFGADFYLSIHHNAGINGGSGGGIMAYVCASASAASKEWQKALYDALIDKTGLKGNRAAPLSTANFYECSKTTMPAVLLELGFMDSSTDVPIILSEDYANKCAEAIVEVVAARGNLTRKTAPTVTAPAVTTSASNNTVTIALPMLRNGSSGEIVKTLQRLLKALDYKDSSRKALSVDGEFGAKTEYAVKALQKAYGLGVDGIVDNDTWPVVLGV